MFGIGAQEMVIIGLLLLVVFGPGKLPNMARDLGRFVSEARRSIEEFKEDLAVEEEGSKEPGDGRGKEASLEQAGNVRYEDDAEVAPNAPRS